MSEKSLRDAVDKAEKALDDAKEKFILAADRLEEARVAYQDFRGEEAEKSQVKVEERDDAAKAAKPAPKAKAAEKK